MNYKRLLKKINKLKLSKKVLTDTELQTQTNKFREMILRGEKEENIIVESFATVREAANRVLKLFPTDEQVLGALVLYHGNIAEIKTGEGKSLVATMTLYLKALYLGQVFLVTTNDYLARRDYERVGDVYKWLGINVTDGTNDLDARDESQDFDFERKKKVYSGEIIYISNTTLGFDYLISSLAQNEENRFICPFKFALLDEVDHILLDSAQQPLIISGGEKIQSNYFEISSQFVSILSENQDFKLSEEKDQVWFTESGIQKAKWYFSLPNLLDDEYFALYQHLTLALKATYTLNKDRDYIVEKSKIKLIDRRDGRILEGTKMQSGLHQSLEAKEGIPITKETQTILSVTYQNLFRQFHQLSGMSGTAKVAEHEFINTYNLPVKRIKTHKKNIRKDYKSQKYVTFESKLEACLNKIKELYLQQCPILVITGSIDISELFSMYLLNLGIPHNVLNAKSSVKEALIIKEAGHVGSVTIATSMAGRGTDIVLSKEAEEKGGLAVIITERMMNKRFELQAKGRAGRQGAPGATYTFESLEDDVMKLYMQNEIQRYYDRKRLKKTKIKNLRAKKAFNRAQSISEERGYSQRINALKYDNISILQKQRYTESRNHILELKNISDALSLIWETSQKTINNFLLSNDRSPQEIYRFILDHIDYNFEIEKIKEKAENNYRKIIQKAFEENLKKQQEVFDNNQMFLDFLKVCMVKAIDKSWSNQVDILSQLQRIVESRSTAQKKPIIEFEKEAQKSYENQRIEISKSMLKYTSLGRLKIRKGREVIILP